MKKNFIIYFIFLLLFLSIPTALLADVNLEVPIPVPGGGVTESVKDLGEYISLFYQFFVTSAGILATVMIILGGYQWIVAAGNATKISTAKETITSAVLGLILALTSYVLLNTINPAITSLKPLTVPALSPIMGKGMATKICTWTTELDAQHNSVECGKTVYTDPENPEKEEKCLGVRSAKNNDNYCHVTGTSSGEKILYQGVEESEITIANHPSSQKIFDVNLDNDCGRVKKDGDHFEVGSKCSGLGGKGALRCFLLDMGNGIIFMQGGGDDEIGEGFVSGMGCRTNRSALSDGY